MASVNQVVLLGTLQHTPKIATSRKDGRKYCTLNVHTTRHVDIYDESGNIVSVEIVHEFSEVVAYGKMAESAATRLQKNGGVYVRGHLKTIKYTGKDKTDKSRTVIEAEELQKNVPPKEEKSK